MTLALNSYQTMAVGILLYYLGKFLKARIKFLRTASRTRLLAVSSLLF